jgi:hypothetical protein
MLVVEKSGLRKNYRMPSSAYYTGKKHYPFFKKVFEMKSKNRY